MARKTEATPEYLEGIQILANDIQEAEDERILAAMLNGKDPLCPSPLEPNDE